VPNLQELLDLKQQIKAAIRRNSDRGFVSYSGCNRVCAEMQAAMNVAERYSKVADYQPAFDIYIMVLLETVRLVSHADDSSGCCGEVIYSCLSEIDEICKTVNRIGDKYFLNTLIKTAKNKVFEGWAEWAYKLLKSAVYFVSDAKEAKKIYNLFPILGSMYDDRDYPEKYLITLGITERLEGKEAARKYLFDNLDLDEFRKIVVENAIFDKDFALAVKLCNEALAKNNRGYNGKASQWAYFLEQVYEVTFNTDALIATVREILLQGDTTYFRKLKALYEQQGEWKKEQLPLWQELSKKINLYDYIPLLSQEGELQLLLEEIKQHKSYIVDYGKQLATAYPDEVYKIYEAYILEQASQANDRGKYKWVCSILKSLAGAGVKKQALEFIDHLCELYPRRPAMLEELAGLKQKLNK
jgi:hypothetical protein